MEHFRYERSDTRSTVSRLVVLSKRGGTVMARLDGDATVNGCAHA
jgi:hypothetical protein